MGFWMPPGGQEYSVPTSETGQEKSDRDIKKGAFGKFCVIYSLSFCSLYTVAALLIHAISGTEPGTLTSCVFAFFGTELLTLGTVRVVKKIKDKGEKGNAEADTADQSHAGRPGV